MVILLQFLVLCAAGLALFRLWRLAMPPEPWLQRMVSAGFLLRAVSGQLLFWISWARLPIARSLQLGDGFWIFARDATFYFPEAVAAAGRGWPAIVFYPRGSASPAYMQILAAAVWFLGSAVAIGLLLNLFSYLGAMAILNHWGRREPAAQRAIAIAIAAISLSPSFILWSLQALKDTFFQMLFVAFVAACAAWQRSWLSPGRWRARVTSGLLLPLLLFELAGLRWYFAAALLVASVPFMLMVALQSPGRKSISLAAMVIAGVLLSRSLLLSAGPYLSPAMTAALRLSAGGMTRTPAAALSSIEQARQNFEVTAASTSIEPGTLFGTNHSLQQPQPGLSPVPPPQPPVAADTTQSFSAADEAQIRTSFERASVAWNRNDLEGFMRRYWRSPELVVLESGIMTGGYDRVYDTYRTRYRDEFGLGQLRFTRVQIRGRGDAASVSGRWRLSTSEKILQPSVFFLTLRRFPDQGWKITREEFMSSRLIPVEVPPGQAGRVIAGLATQVLPHSLGPLLGLFRVNGGLGLLWFVDADTIVFDAVLLFACFALWSRRASRWWRNPSTWLLLITTPLITFAIAYSIGNFGTLFRLREIIYLGALLVPITIDTRRPVSLH